MPTVAFTAKWLKSVRPPESGTVDYFDASRPLGKGHSFGLRVSYGGSKSWFVLYRHAGRLRRLKLGTFPSLGLADARDRAKDAQGAILQDHDPAAERQARKNAADFRELATEYLEKYAKKKKRSWRRDAEIINRELVPAFGPRKARSVRRREARELIEGIEERGAPVMANRVREVARKMYNFVLERYDDEAPYFLEGNPFARLGKIGEQSERKRALSQDEIRQFWSKLPETDMADQIQIALRLALVTAQRKGEVIGASKAEFDLDAGVWTIPAERAKNGVEHQLPLAPNAMELIQKAWALSEDSPHLFPSPRTGRPILASAVDQAVRRNRDVFGLEHWTPHDLRRTAATQMAESKVSHFVLKKLLNHVGKKDVTARYDQHDYMPEKRQALEAWSRKLEGILAENRDNNVVELTRP